MERNSGSMFRVTVLLSPGASCTLVRPTRRCGGSLALAGSDVYTCAIWAPARLPVFFSVKVTESRAALSPEYAKVV
jgi:hypothetical protein